MDDIEGQIIVDVRSLSGDLPDSLSWTVDGHNDAYVLELGDGSLLIPVCDEEGNGPGAFLGEDVDSWDNLVQSTIESVAPMSGAAMEYRSWGDRSDYRPPVLTLNTGEQLYPAADQEGNQFGVLYRVQGDETYIIDFKQVSDGR